MNCATRECEPYDICQNKATARLLYFYNEKKRFSLHGNDSFQEQRHQGVAVRLQVRSTLMIVAGGEASNDTVLVECKRKPTS